MLSVVEAGRRDAGGPGEARGGVRAGNGRLKRLFADAELYNAILREAAKLRPKKSSLRSWR